MLTQQSVVVTNDTTLDLDITRDRIKGMTITESLVSRGIMQFDRVVSDTPWQIDEDKDTVASVTVVPAATHPTPHTLTRATTPLQAKEYIPLEIARNKASSDLFAAMMRIAYGRNDAVIIVHHLTFEVGSDLSSVNEIPSADTLIFDHAIMFAVFGAVYLSVMSALAVLTVDDGARDKELRARFLAARQDFKEIDGVITAVFQG